MESDKPRVTIPTELRGHGTLRRRDETASVTFTLIRDKYAHTEPWRLTALPSDPSQDIHRVLDAGEPNDPILLEGPLDGGYKHLSIESLPFPSAHGGVISSDVWRFDLTQGEPPDPGRGDFFAHVFLTGSRRR